MRYFLYASLVVAILLAFSATIVEDLSLRKILAGLVAIFLGVSAASSGMRAILRGRVLVRTREVMRADQPVAFWTTVIIFRFILAALLLGAGLWSLVESA